MTKVIVKRANQDFVELNQTFDKLNKKSAHSTRQNPVKMPLSVKASPFNSSYFLLSYCNYAHARTTGPLAPAFRSTKKRIKPIPQKQPPRPRLMQRALRRAARAPTRQHSIFLDISPNMHSQPSKTTHPRKASPRRHAVFSFWLWRASPHQCTPRASMRAQPHQALPRSCLLHHLRSAPFVGATAVRACSSAPHVTLD